MPQNTVSLCCLTMPWQTPVFAILQNLRLVVDQQGQHSDFYHRSSMLPLRWKLLCDAGNVGIASRQVTMPEPVVVKQAQESATPTPAATTVDSEALDCKV